MTISVSCPNCGKQFRNINSNFAGKKARCTCGTLVRLGGSKSDARTVAKPVSARPVEASRERGSELKLVSDSDLLNVDLMPRESIVVEGVADGRTGNDFFEPPIVDDVPSTGRLVLPESNPGKAKAKAKAKAKPKLPKSKKVKPSRAKRPNLPSPKPPTPIVRTQSDRPSKPMPQHSADESSVVGPAKSLLSDDTFSDLDAILEGAGDASPVTLRTPPGAATPHDQDSNSTHDTQSQTQTKKSTPKNAQSTLGLVAAFGSVSLGFWFGVFAVLTRFFEFKLAGLASFSQSLRSVYFARFGDADVSSAYSFLFITLGWLFWGAGALLVIVVMAQLVNALMSLVAGKSFMGWSDGLTATVGIVMVFLIVAMVFAQSSLAQGINQAFTQIEQPMFFDGDQFIEVDWERQQRGSESRAFVFSMLTGASIPMLVFVFSVIRLFVKQPGSAE